MPAPRTASPHDRPARDTDGRRLIDDSGDLDAPSSHGANRRRLIAATLSALLPGLGQAVNHRWGLARRFAVPSLLVLAIVVLLVEIMSPARLAATFVAPALLLGLLAFNAVAMAWRLGSVVQAFFDRSIVGPIGRRGVIGLVAVVAFVALPHAIAGYYGSLVYGTFNRIFDPAAEAVAGVTSGPVPGENARLNVLLLGLDTAAGRDHALADTMMVVSLDPVAKTVSIVSIPRDLIGVPLGDGRTFAPKINSLMSYAVAHPKEFPKGGMRTLEDAVGALLGQPIHYYAKIDLEGFVRMVDAVGGIDVVVDHDINDPNYPALDGSRGWSITAGPHHLNGTEALAYARIRKPAGESDFTRAGRQQQVLVALRNQAVGHGLLGSLPGLLDALGDSVKTDFPVARLPGLAAIAEDIDSTRVTQIVMTSPLIKYGGRNNPYGSAWIPVMSRIRQMTAAVFPPAGTMPTLWPTPVPTSSPKAPRPSASRP